MTRIEIRCTHCNRLMGKFLGQGEMKCPRCDTIFEFDTQSVKNARIR